MNIIDDSNISNKSAEEDKTEEQNNSNVENESVDETTEKVEESESDNSTEKDKEIVFNSDQQKKVNQIVKDRTSRLEGKVSKITDENEALAEELKTLKNLISSKELEAEVLQKDLTKAKVAISEKVDLKLIESLKGETEEELLEALKVIKTVHSDNPKSNYTNLFNGKTYKTDDEQETDFSGLIHMK